MYRRHNASGIAAAISDTDKAEDSLTDDIFPMQEGPKIEEVMSVLKRKYHLLIFEDEARVPE